MRRAVAFLVSALLLVAVEAENLRADRPEQQAQRRPAPAVPSAAAAAAQSTTTGQTDPNALDQKYCATCHTERAKTGGVALQNHNPAETIGTHGELWEKAVLKLRGGMMPPQGAPRPDEATLRALAVDLEGLLDRHAVAAPDPGHKPVHRLNRTEYGNAVRDLLDLRIDPTQLLPADDEKRCWWIRHNY
jgi:hypothetical protein